MGQFKLSSQMSVSEWNRLDRRQIVANGSVILAFRRNPILPRSDLAEIAFRRDRVSLQDRVSPRSDLAEITFRRDRVYSATMLGTNAKRTKTKRKLYDNYRALVT